MYTKDWLSKWAEYTPIKPVVRDADTDVSYSYRQLNTLSNFLSSYFAKQGIKKGDRVAVIAEHCPEYLVLFGAAQKAGIILVPLNYRLTPREINFLIQDSDPALLIVEDKFRNLVEKEFKPVWSLQQFSDLLKGCEDESHEFESVEIHEDDPLFLLYTSGTTGFPKGAIYSHRMAFWNAINTEMRLDLTSADHTIVCMPPFHTGGWNVFITPFLLHGASFTLMRKFDPGAVLKLLDAEDATIFMGVPTMLQMMVDVDEFAPSSLKSIRYFIVGGEAMPIPLIEKWAEKDIPIRQGFGLTEVGPNIASLHQADAIRKIGSIGTFNFYVEAKLMKLDGKKSKDGEEGELWLKGSMVTPGYWRNKEATENAFEDGWFKTGDVLTCDEEGYYYVTDRIKNMFISGGENVYPAEVEKYLLELAGIKEVAVIGVPDEKWGESGKAFIVRNELTLTEQDIIGFASRGLAKFKIPKHFEFMNELPKNSSGKIDRLKLRNG